MFFNSMAQPRFPGVLPYNIGRRRKQVSPGSGSDPRFHGTFVAGADDGPMFAGIAEITDTAAGEADGSDDNKRRMGIVILYLVSYILILMAAIGQLQIVLVHLTQMEEAIPTFYRSILAIGVVVTAIFVCGQVGLRVREDIRRRRGEKDDEIDEDTPPEGGPSLWQRRLITPQKSIPMP